MCCCLSGRTGVAPLVLALAALEIRNGGGVNGCRPMKAALSRATSVYADEVDRLFAAILADAGPCPILIAEVGRVAHLEAPYSP
jgi:hypothetical protein